MKEADTSKGEFFVENLLEWHHEKRRLFPWRTKREPFGVLVAELMLQRTRAEQVTEVYSVFMNSFAKPQEAAAADSEKIAKILKPLGLRHRIPRFIRLMKELSTKYAGEVPHEFELLTDLPGVGRYVANAVLCFGFGKPVPVVDSNVVRVLSRFFGLSSKRKRAHTDSMFWEFSRDLLPKNKEVRFNEAILDFAALVCKGKPQHQICPVSAMCTYLNRRLPYNKAKEAGKCASELRR